MKHRSVVVLTFAVLVAVAGAAQKNTPPAIDTKKLPKCSLWQVTNAKAPFYLVASIHSLEPNDYPLPSPFEIALNNSQRLVFEYNPNQADEFQKKFAAAGKYPPGQDITKHIHPRTLAWLRDNTRYLDTQYDEKRKKYLTTMQGFDAALQYKPWWIAQRFFEMQSYSDVTDDNGIDQWFEERGRKQGKELGGLETVDEHIAVLGAMSDRDSELVLLDTLLYSETAGNQFHRFRSAWRRGDAEKLWMLDSRLRREAPWIAARMVDNRNLKWIPRIEAEIKSGKPTSIIAGALHFVGPNSVITLLQKRGYTIEQL